MCGIYGEISSQGPLRAERALARLQRIEHRGPDGWGVAVGDRDSIQLSYGRAPEHPNPRFWLGHRRLSILDLSAQGLQPMRQGSLVLLFNGEIYNWAELRADLEAEGQRFQSDHSDAEVLLQAWSAWGSACLPRLRGMFAFAILDQRRGLLFLVRDRLGQKPLYYRRNSEGFSFASELHVLLHEAPASVDQRALAQYLMLGHLPGARSIAEGIQQLLPSQLLCFHLESGRLESRRYWDPPQETELRAPWAWRQKIEELLSEAVALRQAADVPVALFLSGGLDSSLIARAWRGQTLALCAEFQEQRFQELPWARQAAARYGHTLEAVPIDAGAQEDIQTLITALDEPFDGGSACASLQLFQRIGGRAKVVLTGDGGDEVFSGYERYVRHRRRVPLVALLRHSALGRRALERARRPLASHSLLLQGEYRLDYLLRRSRPEVIDWMREPPTLEETLEFLEPWSHWPEGPDVRNIRYLELRNILPGRMLYKLDRLSMRSSIEGRSPFMDHRLVELAFRIPSHQLMGWRRGKRLLKHLLYKDLGRAFAHRDKAGFGHPLNTWFSGPDREKLLAPLKDPQAPLYRLLEKRAVQSLPGLSAWDAGLSSRLLWRLLSLNLYLEHNADRLRC